jgi:O-antigen/teichoic acid export membrane protein
MAVGHVVSQVAWFGSLIVLATLVPPRSFGTFTASIVVVAVAMLLTEAGTRGTIVVTRRLTRAQLRTSVLLNVAAGLAFAGVLAVGAAPLVGAILSRADPNVLRALGVSVVFNAVSIVPLAMLQRAMLFKRHSACVSAAALGASALAVTAALLGAGVWALVARQVSYGLLVAFLAWWNVRDLLLQAHSDEARTKLIDRRRGAASFFGLAAANLVALNLDYVIVGNATDAHRLGLYSLAFMLAFAPLTNFSWKIGTVLFPAASATSDLATVGSRTLRAAQLMSLILLPALVPAVVLAPWLLPGVLGDDWRAIVVPFQILLVAGIGHAIVNVIGESLAGTGNIKLHAWLQIVMCATLAPAMLVLVHVDGIRGAAIAHLIVFAIVASGYAVLGGRRLGITVRDLGAALAPVARPVTGQALAGGLIVLLLAAVDVRGAVTALVATLGGLAVAVAMFRASPWQPWAEAKALVRAAMRGSRA